MTTVVCPSCGGDPIYEDGGNCADCGGECVIEQGGEDHDCVDFAEWDEYPKTWICTRCNTIHDQFGDDE